MLIAGLGNPGVKYELTRHNIGWLVIDQLSFYDKLVWKDKFKGDYAQTSWQNKNIYTLKPKTFMNLSGESVVPMMNFFKIERDDLIVVHDELDLPFGQIAFKKGGGLAGHNGLKSIAAQLGTQEFIRMRVGIGRPKFGTVSDYVLSTFSKDEDMVLGDYLSKCAKALEDYLLAGYEQASQKYNKKPLI
jgi:PTH1 family peptidyl-tRNA hydrolase